MHRSTFDPSALIFAAIFIAALVAGTILQDRTADQDAQLRCRESGGLPITEGAYYGWRCVGPREVR